MLGVSSRLLFETVPSCFCVLAVGMRFLATHGIPLQMPTFFLAFRTMASISFDFVRRNIVIYLVLQLEFGFFTVPMLLCFLR